MLNMDCPSPNRTEGVYNLPGILSPQKPVFALVKVIPEGMANQIQEAVIDFLESSNLGEGIDKQGLYNQTLHSIAQATFLNQGGDFWLAQLSGKVVGYGLARIVTDIDGKLCYWVSQAWIEKTHRHTSFAKETWEKVRQRAKDCLCSHLVIVAGRNSRAYKRFLKLHDYATLLKEDL